MRCYRGSVDEVLRAETLFVSLFTPNLGTVTMWLNLWALMQSCLMAIDHGRRQAGSWSYIQGPTCNHENERQTNTLEWMLSSLYAVLGECCTRSMLHMVYAVLGVNAWSSHGVIERDHSTLCSCDNGRGVDKKERWRMKMGTIWRIQADMRYQW
jgi:hypothetical protein